MTWIPKRVLLAEDNMIIALDTEEMLMELGVQTVLTAFNVAQAVSMIEDTPPDFALLDVRLGTQLSFEIAMRLNVLGIPFAFSTGYADSFTYPDFLERVPRLHKPYSIDTVRALLETVFAGRTG